MRRALPWMVGVCGRQALGLLLLCGLMAAWPAHAQVDPGDFWLIPYRRYEALTTPLMRQWLANDPVLAGLSEAPSLQRMAALAHELTLRQEAAARTLTATQRQWPYPTLASWQSLSTALKALNDLVAEWRGWVTEGRQVNGVSELTPAQRARVQQAVFAIRQQILTLKEILDLRAMNVDPR